MLITRPLAVLFALALVMAMLAACGGDDDDGDSSTATSSTTTTTSSSTTAATTSTDTGSTTAMPEATAAPDAMPTDHGAMMMPKVERVVIGAQTPSLLSNNIGRGLGPQSQIQLAAMYEYLIGTDAETGALIPQLATEWSVEPNGVDFRIKIREGIPFHNNAGTVSWRDVERTVMELGADDSEHTHAPQLPHGHH